MTPLIHPSARLDVRRQAMIDDLAGKCVPTAFLYESSDQSKRWLTVHRAFSPFINDVSCRALYDWISGQIAARLNVCGTHVIGLGCGSGIKDSMLLARLVKPVYWPVDISRELVLEATASSSATSNYPLVIDLARAQDVGKYFNEQIPDGSRRVYTLFGLLPNFSSKFISGFLKNVLNSGDFLLLSANLMSGSDCAEAVKRIMLQYDNPVTRDWLVGALAEMGIPVMEGRLFLGKRRLIWAYGGFLPSGSL